MKIIKKLLFLSLMVLLCFFVGCKDDSTTGPTGNEELVEVTYPTSTTVWQEFQTDTYCEWNNATGSTVEFEIYQGETLKGTYHSSTDNDGHVNRSAALEDWGTGNDFRIKAIDSESNYGWSNYFTIE